jgi:hypothetical protein
METLHFGKIGAEDISFGTGSFEVRLSDGRVASFSQVNISHLISNLLDEGVLHVAGTSVATNTNFRYDDANTVLKVPSLAGGAGAAGTLTLNGTTDSGNPGNIHVNPNGGNVSIGGTSPGSTLHIEAAGACSLDIENNDGGTTGDPTLHFSIAGTAQFTIGVDDSDGDKLKIDTGATLGSSPIITIQSNGFVALGDTTPLGLFHVKSADAGAFTPNTGADDLIIEGTGNAGMTILTPEAGAGNMAFASPVSDFDGGFVYDHTTNSLRFWSGQQERMRLNSSGALLINDTANSFSNAGLTVNQVASADEIFTGKSSSVAHGMTTLTETDTYFFITNNVVASESDGALLSGFSGGTNSLQLVARNTTEDTTKSTAGVGGIMLTSQLKSGTTAGAHSANANLLVVRDSSLARMIVDKEGDIHVDGSATLATYDDHDDIKLLEALKSLQCQDFRQSLGPWVGDHLAVLEQGRVITRDPETDGFFISYKGLQGLFIDTMRQLHQRLEVLESQ